FALRRRQLFDAQIRGLQDDPLIRNAKTSVFMVANGDLKNGLPVISPFVQSQAASIRAKGWKVHLGVVDDRTSIKGIVKNILRLRQEITETATGLVHVQYGSVTALVSYFSKSKLPLVIS